MEKKEKKEKSKLKKALTVLLVIAAVIVGLVIASFIAVFVASEKNKPAPTEPTTTSIYDVSHRVEPGDDEVAKNTCPQIPLNLSGQELEKFEKYLKNHQTDYPFEEYYNIPQTLKLYEKRTEPNVTKHSHDVRVNGKLDAEALYAIVKKNNAEFAKKKIVKKGKGLYFEHTDEQLKQVCEMLCQSLPEIAKKYPTASLDTVCCWLYNLKIIGNKASTAFASVSKDARLTISYDLLEVFSTVRKFEKETTFHHEMVHMFQCLCDDEIREDETVYAISHEYDKLKNNALRCLWFVEASTEMDNTHVFDKEYHNYEKQIGYVESMNLITALTDGDELFRAESICFEHRWEPLWEKFDVTESGEKEEFIKMMRSLEAMYKDFYQFRQWYEANYSDKPGYVKTEKETFLYLELKAPALITLSKLFYRNLARTMSRGNMTLSDMLYLIRLWEADLCHHMPNNVTGYSMLFADTYDEYLEIQSEFFEHVAAQNSITKSELSKELESYSMNTSKKSPNYDLAFLSAEKQAFVTEEFKESFYRKGYPSIKESKKIAEALYKEHPIDEKKLKEIIGE